MESVGESFGAERMDGRRTEERILPLLSARSNGNGMEERDRERERHKAPPLNRIFTIYTGNRLAEGARKHRYQEFRDRSPTHGSGVHRRANITDRIGIIYSVCVIRVQL